jgi:hypothetical protein
VVQPSRFVPFHAATSATARSVDIGVGADDAALPRDPGGSTRTA